MRKSVLEVQKDMRVRQLAEIICQDIRPKDYLSEALAINNWVWANTRYMRDPRTVELVKRVYIIVDDLLAGGRPQIDCDELAALIAALVVSTGGSARFVTVAFQDQRHNGEQQFSHVFAQAQEPRTGSWITLDPVANVKTSNMLRQSVVAKVWAIT